MSHSVLIARSAQKALAQLPAGVYERMRDALLQLADVPRPSGCTKLRNREGWRIRIGDYRAIYEVDDALRLITILHIGPRRDIYS